MRDRYFSCRHHPGRHVRRPLRQCFPLFPPYCLAPSHSASCLGGRGVSL